MINNILIIRSDFLTSSLSRLHKCSITFSLAHQIFKDSIKNQFIDHINIANAIRFDVNQAFCLMKYEPIRCKLHISCLVYGEFI